jgi:hypothetical protein
MDGLGKEASQERPDCSMMISSNPRGIGAFVSDQFTVPQNPIVQGMGDLPASLQTLDNSIADFLNSTTLDFTGLGIPNFVMIGGGALAIMALVLLMPGGSEYRKKSRALRSQYRGYRRITRATGKSLQGV